VAFVCLCGSDDEKSWIHSILESIARLIKQVTVSGPHVQSLWSIMISMYLACYSLFWQMVCTRSKFLKMETDCGLHVNASLRCCNWWKACATSASYFRRTFQGCGKKITTIIFHLREKKLHFDLMLRSFLLSLFNVQLWIKLLDFCLSRLPLCDLTQASMTV